RLSRRAFRIFALISPYSKGGDAKLHPGFTTFDCLVECKDQVVHILPSPIIPTLSGFLVLVIGSLVGKFLLWLPIWIKIVIKVYGVYVIIVHDLRDHRQEMRLHLRQGRIVIPFATILQHPVAVL